MKNTNALRIALFTLGLLMLGTPALAQELPTIEIIEVPKEETAEAPVEDGVPSEPIAEADAEDASEDEAAVDSLFPEVQVEETESLKPVNRTASTDSAAFYINDTVSITENTPSDIFAAATTLTIDGTTSGDIFAIGNIVELNEEVIGSARIGGNRISIQNDIKRNVFIVANEVQIGPDAVITGSVNIYASRVFIAGQVDGSTKINAEHVAINGALNGEAEITTTTSTIGPQAALADDVRITSSTSPVITQEAVGTEYIEHNERSVRAPQPAVERIRKKARQWAIAYLFTVIIGILIITIWPRWSERAVELMKSHTTATWEKGLLFFFVVPLIALFFLFTIIGIPVALVLSAGFAVSIMLGRLFAGWWLGTKFIPTTAIKDMKYGNIAQFIAGYGVLSIIFYLPYVGWLFSLLAGIWGIGAVIASLQRTSE